MIFKFIKVFLVFILALSFSVSAADKKSRNADEEKIDPLREKAKTGDLDAQNELGSEYFFGKNRKQNYTLASFWYSKAAHMGHAPSQFNLALCYDQGLGVDKSQYQAFIWYKKAFDAGVKPAKFNLAMCYAYGIPPDEEAKTPPIFRDTEIAEKYLLELSNENFMPAVRELGIVYLTGDDQSYDVLYKGFALLKRAAEAGDPSAMRLLADCYFQGLGCDKSEPKMIAWLKKASEYGDLEAQAKLAYCYEYGNGIAPDPDKAFELYKSAAERGLDMAMVKMGEYCSTENKYMEISVPDAAEWYKKAADKKNPYALFKLGVFAYEGIGQKADKKKAAEYFFESAKRGNPHAQYNVATLYEEGTVIPIDLSAAFYWFKQAASQNDSRSQYKLGYYYLEGIGTKKNYIEAMRWFAIAAENGNKDAIKLLQEIDPKYRK